MIAMQDRLENISADFHDVDMFLVSLAEQCHSKIEEFKHELKIAEDPFDGNKQMPGYSFSKVRVRKIVKKQKTTATEELDLFGGTP
ncbi:hypothetical protein H7U12_13120 [Rufibacter sp. H-1]|uniref:Uncharacterized protein n=1 Tax=Rufibacter sediminis TaxID=2762756 RepID=A0ABR6VTW7_9BACT|nr:hypothetical protein [Rufibacter sediminis]